MNTPGDTNRGKCSVRVQQVSDTWVVAVSGTVDTLTVTELESAIESVMAQTPASLVVDLLGVEFLASVGIGALVAVHYNLTGRFAVVADGPVTARPLRLVGVADVVDVVPTLDEALTAVHPPD